MLYKFKNIFTLSLNPAFDITMWIEPIGIEKINLIEREIKNPAGKGVNVSRTLLKFDILNKAIIVAGQDNCDTYFIPLYKEGIDPDVIFVPGCTRENYHIFHGEKLVSTMARKGFSVNDSVIQKVTEKLRENLSEGDLLIFGGRFPIGLTKEHFYDICSTVKSCRAKLALDSSSTDIDDILNVKPYLIKPNLAELCKMSGKNLSEINDILNTLLSLNSQGIENIILSMDKNGLIYSGNDYRYKVSVPNVEVKSTIGAGDSTMAGFIYGVQNGFPLKDCVKFAAAFGTASVMSEGTVPPTVKNVHEVFLSTAISDL